MAVLALLDSISFAKRASMGAGAPALNGGLALAGPSGTWNAHRNRFTIPRI